MRTLVRKLALSSVIFAICLGGCATTLENLVQSPIVELRNVQVVGLGFNSQTFLLSFDVSNPNSFALPVRSVSYGIKLDGQRFASGKTPSEFSVPANGDTKFAISVDLNLLQTAPKLLSIVRQSIREDVTYELEGVLAVDVPFAPAVSYRNAGTIRLSPQGL
ncbi:MAG: LEA type 2 family protein [Gammaproteobacteria bacterium]|nr:LEA type 2 family protein [Gammaproteobacteria bacterium]MDH3577502.1 LEA type 2 family protein [Gammaproteobacteria bacterium]